MESRVKTGDAGADDFYSKHKCRVRFNGKTRVVTSIGEEDGVGAGHPVRRNERPADKVGLAESVFSFSLFPSGLVAMSGKLNDLS